MVLVEDIRYANLDLFALHIKDNIPYIITMTSNCKSFNKWGRPITYMFLNMKEQRAANRYGGCCRNKTINIVLRFYTRKDFAEMGFLQKRSMTSIAPKEIYKTIRTPFNEEGRIWFPEMIYDGHVMDWN